MANRLIDFFEHTPDFLYNALVVVAAIVAGLLIKFILHRLFVFYSNISDYFLIKSVIRHLEKPVAYFVPLFMLNLAIPLMRLNNGQEETWRRILEVLLTLTFAVLLISVIKIVEDYIYHNFDLNKEDNLKERKVRTQLQFIRKLLVTLIIIITGAIILLSFESMRKIGAGLLTGVGIGGIIIGFAAQKSLGNLLAGFQIAFTQPIRIDDVLVVEGEWGRVEDITLTYVVLHIWDQRRLILPINYFIEKPFQNWTRVSAELLGAVFLYLDYTVPVNELRKELTRILEENPLWDKKVNALQVTDTKENTIEIRALLSSRNSSEVFDLRCHVRENLITFIQKNHPGSLPKSRTEYNIDPAEVNS